MRSVLHHDLGDPAEVLRQAESDRPAPGRGEVLVRILLSPIHNHDLLTVRGEYGVTPDLPAIGGSEAVGIVEALGEDVDASLKGRRVAAAGFAGAWAEYATIDAEAAIPVPDEMSDEAAAQLIAMPFSALALLEFLQVGKGDWVVQTAANGAVGRIMEVLARERGIRLLNLVRRDEAAKDLREAGAEHVVSTDDPAWVAKAQAILGPDGAQAAIDSVGGAVAGDLAHLLGVDGLLVVFGAMDGAPLPLPSGPTIFKHITVKGFWGARILPEISDEDRRRMFGELIGLLLQGKLELTSGGDYPLDAAADAVKASLTPGRSGKIMFRP